MTRDTLVELIGGTFVVLLLVYIFLIKPLIEWIKSQYDEEYCEAVKI